MAANKQEKVCSNCRYYVSTWEHYGEPREGDCRRRAPTMEKWNRHRPPKLFAYWITVKAKTVACGEHLPQIIYPK